MYACRGLFQALSTQEGNLSHMCLGKQREHGTSVFILDSQTLHAAAPQPGCALPDRHCLKKPMYHCVHRVRRFRRYECCFTGKEAVKWLVDNQKAFTPEEAVLLGNDMARAGLLHHVTFKRSFQNRNSFYRSPAQPYASCEILTMRCETF